ncbi:MAG TPA: energy-coupling factor transporter transmembrane component T [Armatimonadota bacterium]|jgi:energy-coupling factor transport system permease protein
MTPPVTTHGHGTVVAAGTTGWLAGLHPLTKLACNLMLLLFTLAWRRPLPPLSAAVLGLLLLGRAGVPWRRIVVGLLALCPLLLLWTVTGAAFAVPTPGSPAFLTLGGLTVSQAAASWGLARALRVLCVLLFGWLFVTVTPPTDLAIAAVRTLRVPPAWGFAFLAAFGTVPQLRTDLALLRAARHARGLSPNSPLGHLRELPRLGLGLLAAAARRSERTALAMQCRAFGAVEPRTYLREYRFRAADAAALALLAALLTVASFL